MKQILLSVFSFVCFISCDRPACKTISIKAVAVFLAIFISEMFSQAQDIIGQWNGVLNILGSNLVIAPYFCMVASAKTHYLETAKAFPRDTPEEIRLFDLLEKHTYKRDTTRFFM